MSSQPAEGEKKIRADPEALARFAKALASEKPVESKVAEVEWNFSRCPPAQLPFCLMYEYGRSSPEMIANVERWRKEGFAVTDQPARSNFQLQALGPQDFFRLFPEFPQTPWLALDAAEVRKRLKSLPKRTRFLVRSVPVKTLKARGKFQDKVEVLKAYQTSTIQPMEVTWFYHDKDLIAAFRNWLIENRPYRAQEKRGRTEPRVLLNALGAKRLLARHNVTECQEITGEALGKPLFAGDSNWYDAKQKAEDHLAGRLPPLPIERLFKKLPKEEFSEEELNQLWQHWVGLKVSEAAALLRLETEEFSAQMRAVLEKAGGEIEEIF